MKQKYLVGIDVGTTGARCAIFDVNGQSIAGDYLEYPSCCPKPGWVDQDINLLIERTMKACKNTIKKSGIDPFEIASIGFSTQRSVTCPIDKDGNPVRNMISWQDARTGAEVEQMRQKISDEEYYELSGIPMGTTWIITKLLWMRNNEPELYEKTAKFVQNQDLILKAFGADDYYTDLSCMSFYGVWDIKNGSWSKKLMSLFEVTEDQFGKPTPPGTQVGRIAADVAEKTGVAVGTPICVGAGDQNCGVVGMGAIKAHMATVTLGTAGLAILATDKPVSGFGGMMITHHACPNQWEVEGLTNAAASSFRWFKDTIACKECSDAEKTGENAYEILANLATESQVGAGGLLFLPYLATAGTPRWNPNARGSLIGLSFAHSRADIVRSVMEGIVLEIRDIMEGWLQEDMQVDVLRIGGGATKSKLWNKIQADIYGRPVQTLQESESTVLGAALLGGVGAGVFNSIEEGVENMIKVSGEVAPDLEAHKIYEEMYQVYCSAYQGLNDNKTWDLISKIQTKSFS